MEIVTLIVVLVALILAHEFGHFIVAKWFGMRVDEFGIGYPPRALTLFKKGETEYTLNWLPFGGFVRIYGEDGEAQGTASGNSEQVARPQSGRAFTDKPRYAQALVLVAGIAMNLLFAFLIFTAILAVGTPRALSPAEVRLAKDAHLAIAEVLSGSPAQRAGLRIGDVILSAEDGSRRFSGATPADFTRFVERTDADTAVALVVRHANGVQETLFARSATGVIETDPSRRALGVGVATVGTVPLAFPRAVAEGAQTTWYATAATAVGLYHFLIGILTARADFSQISGPIGIAGAVGTASAQGFTDLLSLVAVISINLALINIIPVPALDGGRLLFVAVETLIGKSLHPGFARAVNALGFALLVLLMLAVTAHDLFRIFA